MNHDHRRRRASKRLSVRAGALGLIVAAPIAFLASPAYAATGVGKSGDQLIVTAAAGKINDIFIRRLGSGQFVLIRDRGDTLTPGAGCQTAGREVQCSLSGITRAVLNAGDGNDRVAVNGVQGVVNGQAGNDILSAGFAGAGRNILNGGANDDRLVGGSGDVLRGDAGNDLLIGSKFSDFLFGDDGNDDLRGGDGNDELRGDAGNDRLDGGNGIDDLCIGEIEVNCEADV